MENEVAILNSWNHQIIPESAMDEGVNLKMRILPDNLARVC
jgi:hypothetical protein